MSNPLIDVIVPVYNGEKYIPGFLKQFEGQNCAENRVHFIFVDDGSEDKTLRLLEEASGSGQIPLSVIPCQHRGVSAARNEGIRSSEADYIAFFDVDDICSSDYVSSLSDAAKNGGFDLLLFCSKVIFDGSGIEEGDGTGNPEVLTCDSKKDLLEELMTYNGRFGGTRCILLRKAFVDQHRLTFAEGYPYYEDFEYLYRVIAEADGGIKILDRWLYGYVALHDGSAMARFNQERIRCLSILKDLEPLFDSKVPEFAPYYRRYGVSRIYWSVLWQAALAAPSYGTFKRFAADTGAKDNMRSLAGFPDRKVKLLRRLFFMSKALYYLTVRVLGRRYSKVKWDM